MSVTAWSGGLEESSRPWKWVKNMNDTEAIRVAHVQGVRVFRGAFSTLPPYNAVNNAYRDAGMSWLVPPRSLMLLIPACLVPKKVRRRVEIDPVVCDIWKNLRDAKALIERERFSLDRWVERPIHSGSRSYDNLPADLVFSHKTMIGGNTAVSYSFNPYLLALAMIKEFELYIGDVAMSERPSVTQLALIFKKARSFETWVNMVVGAMR